MYYSFVSCFAYVSIRVIRSYSYISQSAQCYRLRTCRLDTPFFRGIKVQLVVTKAPRVDVQSKTNLLALHLVDSCNAINLLSDRACWRLAELSHLDRSEIALSYDSSSLC